MRKRGNLKKNGFLAAITADINFPVEKRRLKLCRFFALIFREISDIEYDIFKG